MEYSKFDDSYVVRINKGEEVVEKLKELCKKEDIKLQKLQDLEQVI